MKRALVILAATAACRAPADCPSPRGWTDDRITVREDSMLDGPTLRAGPIAGCTSADAAAAYRSAKRAHAAMGSFAPRTVDVHVDVGGAWVDRIETHPDGVLVQVRGLPTAVWIHELTHVRIGRTQGPDGPGERLLAAIEEGVADHVALVCGHPVTRPKAPGPPRASWSALARADLRFDPHPLGEGFAQALVATTTSATTTLQIVHAVRDSTSSSPIAPVVHGLRVNGPPALSRALRTWLPSALWPAE